MTLAFYAPMKPPTHPVPSGDRSMARALIAALEYSGATVTLASTLQTRDGRGDLAVQQSLLQNAKTEVARLLLMGQAANWRAWVTYHNYYKAPDLLGPTVARELGIPYVQIESTRARKRLNGPWSAFARAAEQAADAADLICYFTRHDAIALRRDAPPHQSLCHLPPFIAKSPSPYAYATDGPILSVGMMRHRDKLASYELIAETLALLPDPQWQLQIAGDGPARPDVERLMAPFGEKVTFLGLCAEDTLKAAYESASLFFWPGVNEAFGMAYIEAQAAGLPIIAQDRPGVRDVLPAGDHPQPETGAAGLCSSLQNFLHDTAARNRASRLSYENAIQHHMLPAAAKTLASHLNSIGVSL